MLYTWPTVGLSPMRRVWLSSFLLILVWPGSCGNAEASSVGPSCTATSATAAVTTARRRYRSPARGQRTHRRRRHHRGAGAPRQYALCQRCRIVNQLAARARAAGAQKDYTGRDLYAADHQRALLPEHIATAARGRARPQSGCPAFACFQSIVCSARHLTASCTILLQNLHSRE